MKLFAAGISYKTAPVSLREQLAVIPSKLVCHGCRLKLCGELDEVVVVRALRVQPEITERVLEAEGYAVREAESGREGLQIAQAERPALILVDINLPEMDGLEVTARLRAMPELGAVPIIAVTANVMKGDREKTLAAGCSAYIEKPIDVDLLPVQLAAFLRQ